MGVKRGDKEMVPSMIRSLRRSMAVKGTLGIKGASSSLPSAAAYRLKTSTIGLSKMVDYYQLDLADDTSHVELAVDVGRHSMSILENCKICFEPNNPHDMVEVGDCAHIFCNACTQNYIQFKVKNGQLLTCPINCGFDIDLIVFVDLSPVGLHTRMFELLKLSHIPDGDRIYCPNPNCSNLMSKTDLELPTEEDMHGNVAHVGQLSTLDARGIGTPTWSHVNRTPTMSYWDAHLVSCEPDTYDDPNAES